MSRAALSAALAAVLLVAIGGIARADDPYRIVLTRIDPADFPTVRLVASVVDQNGKPVPGLRPQDLQLREGDALPNATISLASAVSPVALALVIDTSGSMAGRPLADAKAAVSAMISSLGANDQVAILSFNTAARVVQPLTIDKPAALASVDSLAAAGNTAIYDAAIAGADALAGADPKMRRAIVLLTDGVDNSSRTTRSDAVARLARGGYPVYAIGLGNDIDRSTLQALAASVPGGAEQVAPTSRELAAIYAGLAEQILTEYSVEYRSSRTGLADGAPVSFEVALSRGGAVVARATGSFVVPVGRGGRAPVAPSSAPQAKQALPRPAGDARRDSWIVGPLGAMTVLMFVLWLNEVTLLLGGGARRRLLALIADALPAQEEAPRRPLLSRFVRPLRAIGHEVARFLPAKYLDQTRRRLELAGEPMTDAEYVGLCLVLIGGLSLCLGVLALALTRTLAWTLIGTGVGIAAGYAVPGFLVGSLARRRKKAIQRALIPSLDMLALSAEAGLAFDGAISQVVQRWKNPLSAELRRLLLQFQMGRDRKEALRELARRTDVPDIAKFVGAVIQADTLGVGLAKVLHDQAIELRTKRRQRAEEQARLAPVKMMFPMVLLIFPALFVVILGPAVPKLTAIFNVR